VALQEHRDAGQTPYYALLRTAERTFVAQSGLLGPGLPNHRTPYEVLPGPRELPAGAEHFDLKLQTTTTSGIKVVQTLTFHRASYVIDVAYDIMNTGATPIAPYAYFQLTRDAKTQGTQNSMAPSSFTGPAIYNEADKYKKIEF